MVEFLKQLVCQASKLITTDIQVNAKGDKGDLVTNFDYEIEKFVISKLNEKYPDYDIISEEFNAKQQLTKKCFTIDPIDGTINFANGLPMWGIQIACVENFEPCACAIYLPALDELYWADKTGAYLNGKKIQVNNASILNCLYAVEGKNRLPSLARLGKFTTNDRSLHCAAVDFAWTAKGNFGGVMFSHDNYWDYVPGQYLVKQAGGFVFNEKGCHVAANTQEFGEILIKTSRFYEDDTLTVKNFD